MKHVALFAILVSTALVSLNQAADAAPQAIITGVTGTWTNVVSPLTVGLTGLTTNEIMWGTPVTAPLQSGYKFVGIAPPNQGPFAENVSFSLGTFTHTNRPIYASPTPSSITSAQLNVTVNALFSSDNFLTSTAKVVNSVYNFAHNETSNNAAPCADGGTVGSGADINGCADSVTPTFNAGASQSFIFDGLEYFFATSGFNLGPIFWTVENAVNTAQFNGRFITKLALEAEVPLPAALPLLAAGLAGIGYISRRQRKQKSAVA